MVVQRKGDFTSESKFDPDEISYTKNVKLIPQVNLILVSVSVIVFIKHGRVEPLNVTHSKTATSLPPERMDSFHLVPSELARNRIALKSSNFTNEEVFTLSQERIRVWAF